MKDYHINVYYSEEDAIAVYREVIRQQPSNPQLYRRLARHLERSPQWAEAASIYEQAIARHCDNLITGINSL